MVPPPPEDALDGITEPYLLEPEDPLPSIPNEGLKFPKLEAEDEQAGDGRHTPK